MLRNYLFFIRKNFKYQLMTVLFCISIIPFLIIQCTTYYITLATTKNTVNSLAYDQATKIQDNINLLLKNYALLVGSLSSDYTLIEALHTLDNTSDYKTITETVNWIKEKLYLSSFTTKEIVSVSIITSSGILIPYHRNDVMFDYSLYKTINKKMTDTFQIRGGLLEGNSNTEKQTYIYVARRISNLESFQHLGTLVICIDPSIIQKACFNQEGMEYSYSFVLDNNGMVIASPPNILSSNLDSINFLTQEKEHLLTYFRSLDYLDWQLIHIIDESIITLNLNLVAFIGFFLIGITTFILVFIIIKVCNMFTQPIPTLIHAMQEVQKGNLSVQVPLTTQNEFLEIQKTFNYMTRSTLELLNDNAAQYKELIALTESKKEAEIRALEAQINPHFLFNTLDSINWMAIEKEEYEISLMLRNLALILRYTVSNSNEMVPIKSEVDWLHQYLYLQQQRFIGVFDYTIHIVQELYSYKIHKLLLQPLVENAIIHGFEGKTHGGKLDIYFELLDHNFIVIKITDNGCGMSKKCINYINDLIVSKAIKTTHSIGLANVIFRLYCYYPNHSNLYFDSNEYGTTFILHIPILN